ncbi:ArsR/SmtB family transcription factor [Arthrobacter sp. UM1]|uniref:ArsR/SmtB family transcription factor n=1 Tax=Arthrobacter sp. UM1 TaxID=2766776 RepID=UPI001CF62276|nr:metalloregulator ArsR/SmtB family transcription factor [Arthrobacter sp. UM1]MCB4208959.1 winged helix-turn-helix transcriptional regulator [Arthrobacter sp. UM1]
MTERISTHARLESILGSLGEPTRRRIVDALGSEQLSVTEIVEIVGISQPAASKHLKILREAGVILMRPDAQRRLYRVSREAFTLLSTWSGEIAANAKPAGALHEDLTVRPDPVPTALTETDLPAASGGADDDDAAAAQPAPPAAAAAAHGGSSPVRPAAPQTPGQQAQADGAPSFLQNLAGLSRLARRRNGR